MTRGDGEQVAGGTSRGLPPMLAERDLTWARDLLPVVSTVVNTYFRTEVHGMARIPDGPVLLVANHSGGFGSPDSTVFVLGWFDAFGVERPLYWLGHSLLMQIPGLSTFMRRCGVLEATPESALVALRAGTSVIVYPGGEVELHRPWTERNQVQFHGRTGFLRLAREAGVPIVPVVAQGAHNTYLPLTDGRRIARTLGLDRRLNLKTFPASLALPWGLNVGGLLPHLPLPAKIRIEVLDPMDVSAYGEDLESAYRDVTGAMQSTLSRLARAGSDD